MTWGQIAIFGSGMALGGFLALVFAVLVLAPDLKRLRLAVDLLTARRKPGRKPRAAKPGDELLHPRTFPLPATAEMNPGDRS